MTLRENTKRQNKTQMWVSAMSPYQMPKTSGARGNFGHLWSFEQHYLNKIPNTSLNFGI